MTFPTICATCLFFASERTVTVGSLSAEGLCHPLSFMSLSLSTGFWFGVDIGLKSSLKLLIYSLFSKLDP